MVITFINIILDIFLIVSILLLIFTLRNLPAEAVLTINEHLAPDLVPMRDQSPAPPMETRDQRVDQHETVQVVDFEVWTENLRDLRDGVRYQVPAHAYKLYKQLKPAIIEQARIKGLDVIESNDLEIYSGYIVLKWPA